MRAPDVDGWCGVHFDIGLRDVHFDTDENPIHYTDARNMRTMNGACTQKGDGMVKKPLRNALLAAGACAVVGGIATAALVRTGLTVRTGGLFGPIVVRTVTDDAGNRVRIMEVGGVAQSATYLDDRRFELPFAYLQAFDHMFEANLYVKDVLMIGGGGFAYPKYLLSHVSDVKVDVVEIDPVVTSVAFDHFFLDEAVDQFGWDEDGGARLRIFNGDGRGYLEAAERTYDCIINDSFGGSVADLSLADESAARAVKKRLSPGGMYLINTVLSDEFDSCEAQAELSCMLDVLSGAFANVYVIPCVDEAFDERESCLVIATDGLYGFSGVSEHRCSDADEVENDLADEDEC